MISDALRTVPTVTRAVGELARERWHGRELHPDIPAATALASARELEALLRERHPEARVAGVEIVDQGAGTTHRVRLAVRWSRAPDGFDPPPDHLFVKLPPSDLSTRLFVDLMKLGRNEVGFYRDIRPGAPVEAPRALVARQASRGRGFVLVLEDLAGPGTTFGGDAGRLGFEAAVAGLHTLARFHAAFWESVRIERDWRWLSHPDSSRSARLGRLIGQLAMAPALRRHGDRFSPAIRAAAPEILRARGALDRAWSEGPHTILHGDPHLGNLYFRDGGVGLLDWQVVQVGQAMRDVTYFMINAVDGEILEKSERELIAIYREALRSRGVEAPEPGLAFEQYRLHALYVFVSVVVTAASPALQPTRVIDSAIRSVCTALERLDSLAALRALEP